MKMSLKAKRALYSALTRVAPIKAAFLPLTKKQTEPTEKLFITISQKGISASNLMNQDRLVSAIAAKMKLVRRSVLPMILIAKKISVTARNRDTTKQERIAIDQLAGYIKKMLGKE